MYVISTSTLIQSITLVFFHRKLDQILLPEQYANNHNEGDWQTAEILIAQQNLHK